MGDAFLMIRKEIEEVISGKVAIADSPLKGAPHTADMITDKDRNKPYSRQVAAFPAPWLNGSNKFWPTVGRIDNVYGDRNLYVHVLQYPFMKPSMHKPLMF